MRRQKVLVGSVVGISLIIASAFAFALAGREGSKAAEALLPADAFVYVGWDGVDRHTAAWEKTAAYDALDKSGLLATITNIALTYVPADHKADADVVRQLIKSIARKGLSLSVSSPRGSSVPQVVLVLEDAAELEPAVTDTLTKLLGGSAKLQTETIRGRKVTGKLVSENDPVVVGWWAEGNHLVVAFGERAVDAVLDVAEGKSKAIVGSDNWRKYHDAPTSFSPAFCAWLDVAGLRTRFADSVIQEPNNDRPRVTVGQLLEILGLGRMGAVVSRSGFRDQELVSETLIEAPAPRTGVLALFDQRPITLGDLPPLPKNTTGFMACSFDWKKAYDVLVDVAHNVGDAFEMNGSARVDQAISQWPLILGIDLKRDVFDRLDRVACFYNDSAAGIPGGVGFGLALQVNDAAALNKALNSLLGNLQAQFPNALNLAHDERMGRSLSVFEFGSLPVRPALCVDKHWLFVGMTPEATEASLKRVDGKLESWKPSPAEEKTLGAVPKEFVLLSLSDPRPTYSSVVTFLPIVLSGIDAAMKSAGGNGRTPGERVRLLSELPAVDVITRRLFPNVSVCTVDERGVHERSRQSAPDLVSGPTVVAVGAIGTALLLPAVQAAREAARRTQSKNNMKQIVLALLNYHDAFAGFPQGTHPNKDLKPEKRLSWEVDILPYIEQTGVFNQIDFKKAWDDPANKAAISTSIPVYWNPGVSQTKVKELPVTHYVGLAGLGADGPTLPANNPRAGVFAYDRMTRIRDITDGTSNTAAISEASKDFGSWAAGGRPTIRSLTKEPYINGPDGIGGPYQGGVQIGFADGSVRFVSKDIDPKLFKALMTISGGEPGLP